MLELEDQKQEESNQEQQILKSSVRKHALDNKKKESDDRIKKLLDELLRKIEFLPLLESEESTKRINSIKKTLELYEEEKLSYKKQDSVNEKLQRVIQEIQKHEKSQSRTIRTKEESEEKKSLYEKLELESEEKKSLYEKLELENKRLEILLKRNNELKKLQSSQIKQKSFSEQEVLYEKDSQLLSVKEELLCEIEYLLLTIEEIDKEIILECKTTSSYDKKNFLVLTSSFFEIKNKIISLRNSLSPEMLKQIPEILEDLEKKIFSTLKMKHNLTILCSSALTTGNPNTLNQLIKIRDSLKSDESEHTRTQPSTHTTNPEITQKTNPQEDFEFLDINST